MIDDNRRLVQVVVEEERKLLGEFDFLRLPSVCENVRVNDVVFVVTKVLHNVGPNARYAAALAVRRMESDDDYALRGLEAAFVRSPEGDLP
jgi:hypothetical protein